MYKGDYENDLKHGRGVYSYPDKSFYDGEWHKGKQHGQGKYVDSSGNAKIGIWSNGKFAQNAGKTGQSDN